MGKTPKDDQGGSQSQALIPYQRMDIWDTVLQRNGESRETALDGSTTQCPPQKDWMIFVRVQSTEKDLWPDKQVTFGVDFDKAPDELTFEMMTGQLSRELLIEGKGPDRGITHGQVSGWEVVEKPTIILPGDNGKTFFVKIQPRPWLAIRVRYHDRDEVVPGVKVKLAIPGRDSVEVATMAASLRFEQELESRSPVTITGLQTEAKDGLWEVVL